MAFRSWARVLLTAAGVGLVAGAAQLGVGYGLSVVRLSRTFGPAARDEWTVQVAWVIWFAMVATVLGAVAGHRLARRHTGHPTPDDAGPGSGAGRGRGAGPAAGGALHGTAGDAQPGTDGRAQQGTDGGAQQGTDGGAQPGAGAMFAVLVCGGVGAAAVAPLAMVPALDAVVPAVDTAPVIGRSVLLGVLVAALVGSAVLVDRAVRWNVVTAVAGGWLLALVSVGPSLDPTDPQVVLRLGVFEPAWLPAGLAARAAVVTLPALALVLGAVAGWVARGRGTSPAAAAVCGLPGPALFAGAYLIAGPGSGAGRLQDAPYWGAVVAVAAGLLGSVLAVVVQRSDESDPDPTDHPAGLATPTNPAVATNPAIAATGPAKPASATGPGDPDTATGRADRGIGTGNPGAATGRADRGIGTAEPGPPLPRRPVRTATGASPTHPAFDLGRTADPGTAGQPVRDPSTANRRPGADDLRPGGRPAHAGTPGAGGTPGTAPAVRRFAPAAGDVYVPAPAVAPLPPAYGPPAAPPAPRQPPNLAGSPNRAVPGGTVPNQDRQSSRPSGTGRTGKTGGTGGPSRTGRTGGTGESGRTGGTGGVGTGAAEGRRRPPAARGDDEHVSWIAELSQDPDQPT